MSYIYIPRNSSYYSDSDESFGGCPCQPCDDPDPLYTEETMDIFVPPPGLDPNLNGFPYQVNSAVNYPAPTNDSDLGNTAYDTLPEYPYSWAEPPAPNYGVSDDAEGRKYTIYFGIGTPSSPKYNWSNLWTDSSNSATEVTGPFTDLNWNGVTVLPGQYWRMQIQLADTFDRPDLRVLFQMTEPGACNPVQFGFKYAPQEPPPTPIAKYSESPTGIYVQSDDPRDTFAECDAVLVGRVKSPSGTTNMEWYGTRRFNSSYWTVTKGLPSPPTQIKITISVSTTNYQFFTDWQSFVVQGGNLQNQVTTGVFLNGGPRAPWSTNGGTSWPTITFPYEDGPSSEWPNSPHEQDFLIDFVWPLSMANAQELEARYDYLDASNNVLVTHFQKDLVTRDPLNKSYTPPLSECFNDFNNYNYPSPLDWFVAAYRGANIVNYRSRYNAMVRITDLTPSDSVAAIGQPDYNELYFDPNSDRVGIHQGDGVLAPDMYLCLPMWGEDGSNNYDIAWHNTKYTQGWHTTSQLAGSPRNLIWSVCMDNNPNVSGVISQHTVLQNNGTVDRDLFADNSAIGNIKGLFYWQYNCAGLPRVGTSDDLDQAFIQWTDGWTVRMPSYFSWRERTWSEIPNVTDGTNTITNATPFGNYDMSGKGVFNVDVVLDDIAPGDAGRSIRLIYRYEMDIENPSDPGNWRYYKHRTRFDLPTTVNAYKEISLRDYFDPVTNRLHFNMRSRVTVAVPGHIVYLADNRV